MMHRRIFLRDLSIALLGTAASSPVLAASQNMKRSLLFGIQLYTLAKPLSDDFRGTIETLAKTGYKKLEFAGPYYFSSQKEVDSNFLIKMMGLKGYGYYGLTPKELKQFLDDQGLTAPSAHISIDSLDHNLEEAINAAKIIGHEYLIVPMLRAATLDEFKSATDKFNKIGEACKKAGVGFAYHNHSFEFGNLEGQIPLEVLLKGTAPDLVSFEMDLFWTEVAGVDPLEFINKYPGRFKLFHLKDMAIKMEEPSTDLNVFSNPAKARAILSNQCPVGDGVIDFEHILKKSRKAGIKHLYIESDFPSDPVAFAKKSFANVSKMKF